MLDVSQPSGDMVLDDSSGSLVLASAGIGITPVAAIMADISRRQPDRAVWLLHADRSHREHALYAGLRRQVVAMPHVYSQTWYENEAESAPTLRPAHQGFMDLSDIDIPADATAVLCGPLEFMRTTRLTLLAKGLSSENIHYEVFGPDLWAQSPPE